MTPWGTAPGDAGEQGGESERAQHPTVGGWGGGSGPVVEWERERGRQKLMRGERVDKRKYNTFPWPISRSPAAREGFTGGWNSTRLLPGQRHGKQK